MNKWFHSIIKRGDKLVLRMMTSDESIDNDPKAFCNSKNGKEYTRLSNELFEVWQSKDSRKYSKVEKLVKSLRAI